MKKTEQTQTGHQLVEKSGEQYEPPRVEQVPLDEMVRAGITNSSDGPAPGRN